MDCLKQKHEEAQQPAIQRGQVRGANFLCRLRTVLRGEQQRPGRSWVSFRRFASGYSAGFARKPRSLSGARYVTKMRNPHIYIFLEDANRRMLNPSLFGEPEFEIAYPSINFYKIELRPLIRGKGRWARIRLERICAYGYVFVYDATEADEKNDDLHKHRCL